MYYLEPRDRDEMVLRRLGREIQLHSVACHDKKRKETEIETETENFEEGFYICVDVDEK